MANEFKLHDEARTEGITIDRAESIDTTAMAIRDLFDASSLDVDDLYYLTIASAIRMALQSGAPANHLRDGFFRALDAFMQLEGE